MPIGDSSSQRSHRRDTAKPKKKVMGVHFRASRFRSSDLWVMGPTRFHCAKARCRYPTQ